MKSQDKIPKDKKATRHYSALKNLYVGDRRFGGLPRWLLPLVIIMILCLSLILGLPRLIRRLQPADPGKVSHQQTDFRSEADAVVCQKLARVYQRASLRSKLAGSALYNEAVTLLEKEADNGFYKVRLWDGLEGYILGQELSFATDSLKSQDIAYKVMVVNGEKAISSDTINGDILALAPMGSVLYADYATERVVRVLLPGPAGCYGWINRENVVLVDIGQEIPKSQGKVADIFCSAALKFLNIANIPGGLGLDGIDLPGVIYLASITNGQMISRSIHDQAKLGTQISLEKDSQGLPNISGLKPGDLVFFYDYAGQSLSSAGIYIADDNMLYADGNASSVQIVNLAQQEKLLKRLATARRIFD